MVIFLYFKTGVAPEGQNALQLPVGEKLTIRRGIFTNDNALMYYTNYLYLFVIKPRKKINSFLHYKSKNKLFLVSCFDDSCEKQHYVLTFK